MKQLSTALLTILTLAPVGAFAGGSAVLVNGSDAGGQQGTQATLEFDGDLVRINVSDPQAGEAYMLMRDGGLYMVSQQAGQLMVIDMAGMLGMLGNVAQEPTNLSDMQVIHSLKDTGRTETIAGIRGRVYDLVYDDGDGQRQYVEVVLGKNRTLRELTQAMTVWGDTMSRSLGNAASNSSAMDKLLDEGDGILRFGAAYQLTSLDSKTPDASRFVLPAAPMQMPAGLGDIFSGATGGAASGGANPLGDVVGGQVQRQRQRVESRTQGEVDAATDRAVDNVFNRAVDRLFGR